MGPLSGDQWDKIGLVEGEFEASGLEPHLPGSICLKVYHWAALLKNALNIIFLSPAAEYPISTGLLNFGGVQGSIC